MFGVYERACAHRESPLILVHFNSYTCIRACQQQSVLLAMCLFRLSIYLKPRTGHFNNSYLILFLTHFFNPINIWFQIFLIYNFKKHFIAKTSLLINTKIKKNARVRQQKNICIEIIFKKKSTAPTKKISKKRRKKDETNKMKINKEKI